MGNSWGRPISIHTSIAQKSPRRQERRRGIFCELREKGGRPAEKWLPDVYSGSSGERELSEIGLVLLLELIVVFPDMIQIMVSVIAVAAQFNNRGGHIGAVV